MPDSAYARARMPAIFGNEIKGMRASSLGPVEFDCDDPFYVPTLRRTTYDASGSYSSRVVAVQPSRQDRAEFRCLCYMHGLLKSAMLERERVGGATGGIMSETKNVFISHVHKDDHGLQKLKDLLGPKGMDVRDSSIHTGKFNDAKAEGYIKTQILAPAINWAGTFICYVTPQTKNSEWVNWEIEYAAKQGKRIVGVWEHGERECELPAALEEYADALVGWNGNSIIDAINGKDSWEKPDGGPCPAVPLKRHPC